MAWRVSFAKETIFDSRDAPPLLMIVRRVLPCFRQASPSLSRRQISQYGRVQRRYSSSASGTTASAAPMQSPAAPTASITSELDKLSPRFDVPADSIEILRTPKEFYATLKVRSSESLNALHWLITRIQDKISNAKHRIYLSTLYVGKSEHELVCISIKNRRSSRHMLTIGPSRLPPSTMH